ncbi:hypothetical protein [Pseudomonas palleroniana]
MLNRIFAPVSFFSLFLSVPVFAATPQFSDYEVESVYQGRNAPLQAVDSAGDNWDNLRALAVGRKVNFAGHYIVFTGDCGGASTCGEVIDAQTGKVITSLPNAYQTYDEETQEAFVVDYKANSKLMVVMGVAQDTEVDASNVEVPRSYRTRYYEFNGKDFRLILSKDK